MTTTHTTTVDDRMEALEVSTHGLQRQIENQREELSGVRDAMAALTDTIAQLPQDHNNYDNPKNNNEDGSVNHNQGGQNNHGGNTSGLQGGNNGEVQSRFVRLDFPRFNGEDPTGWINIAEQFFHYHGTAAIEKVLLTSFHLQGEALQ